jgi:uncharacterized coiled-coil DUF342 family protein
MENDPTRKLDDGRSFEERVFARFDAIDAVLRDFGGRIENLEARSYDTKPIWERALREILETQQEVKQTRQELRETQQEVKQVRQELKETRQELRETQQELKETRQEFKQEFREMRQELKETRQEFKETRREFSRRLDRIEAAVLEEKALVSELEDRIEMLESKSS